MHFVYLHCTLPFVSVHLILYLILHVTQFDYVHTFDIQYITALFTYYFHLRLFHLYFIFVISLFCLFYILILLCIVLFVTFSRSPMHLEHPRC